MMKKRSPQPIVEDSNPVQAGTQEAEASEKELRESGQRFRHIFENSPVMVYRSDYNGRILDINEAGVNVLGYVSKEEIIGREAAGFLYAHPKDRQRFQKTKQ